MNLASFKKYLRALRLPFDAPATLLFTAAAILIAATPIASLILYVALHMEILDVNIAPYLAPLARHLPTQVLGLSLQAATYAVAIPLFMAISFACMLIGSMLNTAIIGCFVKKFERGDASVGDGFAAIWANLRSFLPITLLTFSAIWALAFVSRLLGAAEKDGPDDALLLLSGLAAEGVYVASALVLTIMIVDGVGFQAALKRAYDLKRLIGKMLLYCVVLDGSIMIIPTLWGIGMLLMIPLITQLHSGFEFILFGFMVVGIPFLLLFASVILSAILFLGLVSAVYLEETRKDPAIRGRIESYFPGLLDGRDGAGPPAASTLQ
ncbi:MAG: hypothetical protein KGL74_14960 [Elusimicrobia bacterium]|nr:hypothetical protein [Elusimicrobiota bacterium]